MAVTSDKGFQRSFKWFKASVAWLQANVPSPSPLPLGAKLGDALRTKLGLALDHADGTVDPKTLKSSYAAAQSLAVATMVTGETLAALKTLGSILDDLAKVIQQIDRIIDATPGKPPSAYSIAKLLLILSGDVDEPDVKPPARKLVYMLKGKDAAAGDAATEGSMDELQAIIGLAVMVVGTIVDRAFLRRHRQLRRRGEDPAGPQPRRHALDDVRNEREARRRPGSAAPAVGRHSVPVPRGRDARRPAARTRADDARRDGQHGVGYREARAGQFGRAARSQVRGDAPVDDAGPAAPPDLVAQADGAPLLYVLQTPVAANWIPFLPVCRGAANNALNWVIELQRGVVTHPYQVDPTRLADPRNAAYADFILRLRTQTDFVEHRPIGGPAENPLQDFMFHPRGSLLRRDPNAAVTADYLRMAEEEVPRDGIELKRSFNYARNAQGRALLWIGRSKITGRGEGHSGLKFDVVKRGMR